MEKLIGYQNSSSESEEEIVEKPPKRAEAAKSSSVAVKGSGEDCDNYETLNMDLSDDEGTEKEPRRDRESPAKRTKHEVQSSSSKHDRKESQDRKRPESSRNFEVPKHGREERYSRSSSSKEGYRKDKRDDKYRRVDRGRRDEKEERRREHRHHEDRRERKEHKRDRSRERRSSERRVERRRSDRSRSKSPVVKKRSRSRSPEPQPSSSSSSSITAYHAERKLAKLDSLGLTLNAKNLTMASSKPDGVEIPAYYNQNAINVAKYADQIQKRKLLWSGKKAEATNMQKTWGSATFSQDTDGKVASKFMRLMGIKDPVRVDSTSESGSAGDDDKQKKLFSTLDQQYEVARQVTHTMRGVGLGFGSQRQF